MKRVNDIRAEFVQKYKDKDFFTDAHGNQVIEIIGASFLADEDSIIGVPNQDYIQKEIDWYRSESLNVNDIYGESRKPPKAWVMTADPHGNINSNYGSLIFSKKYYSQYKRVVNELIVNPSSRRATMVYTRPSIWVEYNEGGKSDFICTNAVTYYIRNDALHCVVQMRSNDAWAGYRNDYAWQKYVQHILFSDIAQSYSDVTQSYLNIGDIHWQVQNLHVYSRNFKYLEELINDKQMG